MWAASGMRFIGGPQGIRGERFELWLSPHTGSLCQVRFWIDPDANRYRYMVWDSMIGTAANADPGSMLRLLSRVMRVLEMGTGMRWGPGDDWSFGFHLAWKEDEVRAAGFLADRWRRRMLAPLMRVRRRLFLARCVARRWADRRWNPNTLPGRMRLLRQWEELQKADERLLNVSA